MTRGNKDKRPLAGRRIVITRRREQAGTLRAALEKKGAKVISLPAIATVPPPSWKPLDEAIDKLDRYDWLIFTSTNGVDFFFERLRKKRKTVRALRGKRVAAIGPATARALKVRGVKVKVVPEDFIAEGLLRALGRSGWRGQRVLLARAAQARQILPRELRQRGATVHVVPVYQTILPPQSKARVKSLFAKKKPDAITFTSSSTVKNFFALAGRARAKKMLEGVAVAAIGPVTSRTARTLGLRVAVEARTYTIPGLAQALAHYFTPTKSTLKSIRRK